MAKTDDMNLNLVWNTLMFFAQPYSYILGERTGGVLAGCPRKPPPDRFEMADFAKRALGSLREYVGGEAEQWMLDGKFAPTAADAILRELVAAGEAGIVDVDPFKNSMFRGLTPGFKAAWAAARAHVAGVDSVDRRKG